MLIAPVVVLTYGPCIASKTLSGAGTLAVAVVVARVEVATAVVATLALVLVVAVAVVVAVVVVPAVVVAVVVVVVVVGRGITTESALLAAPAPVVFCARMRTMYVLPAVRPVSVVCSCVPEPLLVVALCHVVPSLVLIC